MRVRLGIASVALLLGLLLLPSAASAQAIGGTVSDETGGVLPGVTIEVRSPALIEQVRTAISDGSGQYLITGLVSGEYSVSFGLAGFSTVLREGIVLSAGFQANVDAQLAVGSVEETITVTGSAPTVDVSTVQQNTAIDRDIIDTIPSGKSFQNLGILIPGMVGDGVVGSTLAVDVGGQGGVNYQRLGDPRRREPGPDGADRRHGRGSGHPPGRLVEHVLRRRQLLRVLDRLLREFRRDRVERRAHQHDPARRAATTGPAICSPASRRPTCSRTT